VGKSGVPPDRVGTVLAVLSAVVMVAVAIGAWIDWTDIPPIESSAASRATVATDDGHASGSAGSNAERKKRDGAEKDAKRKPRAASAPRISATPKTDPGSEKSRPETTKSTPN